MVGSEQQEYPGYPAPYLVRAHRNVRQNGVKKMRRSTNDLASRMKRI